MSEERYPTSIRDWANDLREDAKAADVFGSMASDEDEKRAAAWLRGVSAGLRLAAMRTYSLADALNETEPAPINQETGSPDEE